MSGAIVTVSIEWDGTHITITNETLDDAGITKVTDVASMLTDCTSRAMEAVWNGLNKEEQR